MFCDNQKILSILNKVLLIKVKVAGEHETK